MLDKENHNGGKLSGDHPTLTREMFASEEMDQIRPEGASPTGNLSPIGAAMANETYGGIGGGSRGGGNRNSKQDAVIAAAESAMADKERQETYDTRLTQAIWELATTGANPAVDLLVCLERRHTIGFRYVDITRPVVIHHGSRDTRVPVENVRWLGKMMKRCEVRVLEGEGHGLMASPTCMWGILTDVAKEWEDWMRVTGATARKEEKKKALVR
jgi:pimeloyl-ACP methyl ester carboxylesterase